MSFTFLDQQNLLSILLQDSNSSTDDAWPITIRKKYINRGEMQFAKDTKLIREKATGTVSSSQISVPSDHLETIALIVNSYNLTKDREIDIRDYDRWYTYSGSYPMFYISEESGTLYYKLFGGSAGDAYSLYYIKKPSTELSGDTDTSIFPEELREASVYWAAGQLFQQFGKMEMADRYNQIYMKFVRDGQERAERLYLTKIYATPDVNSIESGSRDYQGQSFDFA